MATIGTDCQLILDGTGYYIEPHSYKVSRPRVMRGDLTGQAANPVSPGAGSGERFIDRGPAKRDWKFIVVAYNSLTNYDGTANATTGQAFHDAIQTSYNQVNTILSFTDPHSLVWSVRMIDRVEELVDVRSQIDGLQWYMHL